MEEHSIRGNRDLSRPKKDTYERTVFLRCLSCLLSAVNDVIFLSFVFSAHNGQVRGVAIDNINQQVMTAGADCKLKVKWQLFMFNVCVYFGSKLNFFTRIRISSKMMQRKPSCDENILEQHQFWRYLSTFSSLFSPSSQNNYVSSHLKQRC